MRSPTTRASRTSTRVGTEGDRVLEHVIDGGSHRVFELAPLATRDRDRGEDVGDVSRGRLSQRGEAATTIMIKKLFSRTRLIRSSSGAIASSPCVLEMTRSGSPVSRADGKADPHRHGPPQISPSICEAFNRWNFEYSLDPPT